MHNQQLPPAKRTHVNWGAFLICLVLVLVTFGSFSQVLSLGFVNYDDNTLVFENPYLIKGLTLENIHWAIVAGTGNSTAGTDYWRPLSIISTMADMQYFGLHAGAHHAVNLLLHVLTSAILFLVLRSMTGTLWKSTMVAALFAIHPLHVESVAWVAERKDVLCGFFFVLTLAAYTRYARRPFAWVNYLAVLLCCAMALSSKPMAVTIPCVLLLLDYWPLHRLEVRIISIFFKRLVEKLPLFAMSAACAWLATRNPEEVNQGLMASLSIPWRLGNAVVSYADYLRLMMWPSDLSVFYPHPGTRLSLALIGVSSALLTIITTVVIRLRERRYLTVGWLWYLGMLVPVIGIVQSGLQSHADRYTYLPLIGIFIMLVWSAGEWAGSNVIRRRLIGLLGTLWLTALIMITRTQTAVWSTSETLWTHALQCDPRNSCAEYNLGCFYLQGGHPDQAIIHYQRALVIDPKLPSALSNLGEALRQTGRLDEALSSLKYAAELNPKDPDAQNNLANTLFQKGAPDQALSHYERALQLKPSIPEAHNMIGTLKLIKGDQKTALSEFQQALALNPENLTYMNNVAWILATSPDGTLRNAQGALELAQRGVKLSKGQPDLLRTLAAAQAAVKNYRDAVTTAKRAMELATSQGNKELPERLRNEITLYQSGSSLGE